MMIPPMEQYLPSYTVSTPAEGFSPNFINVIAPKSAVGSVEIDGTPIPAGNFTSIGDSGFSGAQVPVEPGSHTVASRLPIGVHSYGFGFFDSYGYPGGLSLSEVARVENVSLTPETATNTVGTEHCLDALVTDQNGNPLLDIRVDFTVGGANTASGFAFTGDNGVATFCYVGSNAGDDQISAAVGDLADTAAKTWTAQPDNTPPETNITGGPSGPTKRTDASFSFESTERGARASSESRRRRVAPAARAAFRARVPASVRLRRPATCSLDGASRTGGSTPGARRPQLPGAGDRRGRQPRPQPGHAQLRSTAQHAAGLVGGRASRCSLRRRRRRSPSHSGLGPAPRSSGRSTPAKPPDTPVTSGPPTGQDADVCVRLDGSGFEV